MYYFKYALMLALFLSACKKEKESSLNFSEINSGTSYNLRCIFQHPYNGNEIFIGGGDNTHGLLLLSTNKGASFNIFSQPFPSRINAFLLKNSYFGFVVGNNFLLMKSIDRGETWKRIENTSPVPYQYQTHLYDIKFVNDSIGFFCGGQEYAHGIIGKTTDGGQTWKYKFVDHEMRSISFKDPLHGYCGGYGVMYFTEDGGENWQLTESNNEFITSINFNSSNGVACGYEGGILRNQNSLNWEKSTKSNYSFGLRNHYNTVCSTDNNNYFVFGNNGKCAMSNDSGNNWQQATAFNDNTIFSSLALTPTSGIVVGESGKIFLFNK